jgi:hypothetical protein
MKLEKILALLSLCFTAAAVLLFAFSPPSSPELSLVLAVGVSFVLLLLFSFSVMEAPEEEEEVVVREAVEEEKGGEVISKLMGALEEGRVEKPEREERREEKPRPDLLSGLEGLFPPKWKSVGEGRVGEETLLTGKVRGVTGFFKLWEGEGKRLALYTFLFPSQEDAESHLRELMNKLKGLLHEHLPGGRRFYVESEGIDGAVWGKGKAVILLLLGKGEKGEVSNFLEFLPENLRPSRP